MMAAMAGYVVNDGVIKLAAESMPLFQAIFVRGLMVAALLGALLIRRGETAMLRTQVRGPVLTRVALETVGTIAFLSVLTRVPLAPLTAVMQFVPIAVTFFAARLLREAVSWQRIAAVVVGFVGVLFVIRPGTDAFSPWFLLGLLTVFIVVARDLVTRQVPESTSSTVIAFATAISITVMGGVFALFESWTTVDLTQLAQLAVAAAALGVGYLASVVGIRTGDVSFTAAFRYTVLIFAIALQIVLFGEVPDVWTFVGAAIIAAAGVFAATNERVLPDRLRMARSPRALRSRR